MSRTVSERLESLRDELRRLDPSQPGLRRRVERLQRQISMLTEDERQKPALPKQARRFT